MSLLDDDIEKQADMNLKAWEEEQEQKRKQKEREYFSVYTWEIDGEKIKFGNNDFHLSELDLGYKVYRF